MSEEFRNLGKAKNIISILGGKISNVDVKNKNEFNKNKKEIISSSKIITKRGFNTKEELTVQEKIIRYIRAKYPILYFDNFDFNLVSRIIDDISDKHKVIEYNNAIGQVNFKTRIPMGNRKLVDLEDFLNEVKNNGYDEHTIILLRDVHGKIEDANIISLLKYIIERNLYNDAYNATVFIVASKQVIPKELLEFITVVDIPLPTLDDIKNIVLNFIDEKNIYVEDNVIKYLVSAFKGHNEFQITQILNLAYQSKGTLTIENKDFLVDQKKQFVKKSNILEIVDVDSNYTFDKIGGLDNLKKWLFRKERIFNELEKAKAFGVDVPKGVLVLGMSGCGKSLVAKTSANLFKIPLTKLDVGRFFGKDVIELEENMCKALKLIDAISPCILWIDEIEEVFSGLDGCIVSRDISKRLFVDFLTLVQKKEDRVFIIATADDVSNITLDFLKKSRFDEVFFVDFPNASERYDIINIHINKRVQLEEQLDIGELVEATEGYSGADIEIIIKDAIETCYIKGINTLTVEELLRVQKTKPISEISEQKINDIKSKIEKKDLKPASGGINYSTEKNKILVIKIDSACIHNKNNEHLDYYSTSNSYFNEQKELMKSWRLENNNSFVFVENYEDADIVLFIGEGKPMVWDYNDDGYSYQPTGETAELLSMAKWDYKPIIIMRPKDCINVKTKGSKILKENAISLNLKYGPKYLEYAIENWPKEHNRYIAEANYGQYEYSREIYNKIDGIEE